ncbi:hypothetical protein [Staphylospora marina]|uniref:hypothetical protein n=1 Tax=Staphylospora marina TaxID=2490858 RepID=UPI000F5BF5BD|nr:hypothetical protein [Staphylospora marina]
MRVFAWVIGCLLMVTGCQSDMSFSRKTVPLIVRVIDLQGKPVSGSSVGITAVIPEELKGEVGAVPVEVRTDRQGQLVQMVGEDSEYEVTCGSTKMKVKIGKKPVSVDCVTSG